MKKLFLVLPLLFLISYITFVPSKVSALLCFNIGTSVWFDAGDVITCPQGTTQDPGTVVFSDPPSKPPQQSFRDKYLALPGASTKLGGIILTVLDLLGLVSLIVGALALIWFFWGIIQYVLKADNEDAQKQARGYMIYAVIGMFVMFSIWGLVNLIRNTFPGVTAGIQESDIPKVPVLK